MEMDMVGKMGDSARSQLPPGDVIQIEGIILQKDTCRIWDEVWASQPGLTTWSSHPIPKQIIYVSRNAKDTMVSYYHFQRMNKRLPDLGTWDEYFESFLAGKGVIRDWKNQFTDAQTKKFNEDYEKHMADTSLSFHMHCKRQPT